MNKEELHSLATKFLNGTATAAEKEQLQNWYMQGIDEEITVDVSAYNDEDYMEQALYHKIKQAIKQQAVVTPVHRVHFLKTSWFRYAAAVILLIGGTAIWWEISRSARNDGANVATVSKNQDILPGTNRAVLTVGNNKIDLATNKTGIAVGSTITYNDGERIADADQLLQLTTPRGGQYQAVLPDGTKVWLNAASSIKFPSKFSGTTREVEIAGEAYLEIAKNAKQPFYVHTTKETIQVLGTSFNVNAYEDEEAENTTLVEGSVRVVLNNERPVRSGYALATPRQEELGIVLKPGQQASLTNGQLSVADDQEEAAIAWKAGLFKFKEATIKSIMRQIEKWYDVDVVYEDEINVPLVTTIPRSVPLTGVLEALEKTGVVHFKREGRKVIVTK